MPDPGQHRSIASKHRFAIVGFAILISLVGLGPPALLPDYTAAATEVGGGFATTASGTDSLHAGNDNNAKAPPFELVFARTALRAPGTEVARIGRSEQLLMLRFRNGDVITHRTVDPGTLSDLGIHPKDSAEDKAEVLLGSGPNALPDTALARREIGCDQVLYARIPPNRAGFRAMVVIDNRTVHYLDMDMREERFMAILGTVSCRPPEQ